LKQRIVILGPAHPYRGGGITTFNERLATALQEAGHDVCIYNFTLQYPSFLFPGKTQYTNEAAPAHLQILRKVNSINPINWLLVGGQLKKMQPDFIIVRFWLPFMGPAFGSILRLAKSNRHTKVIAITDNVIPHEKRMGDKPFTRYFLKSCDAFVTMSDKVLQDLKQFHLPQPAIQVAHPLYDNFGAAINKETARQQLDLAASDNVLLFFGFIRKYKGLDLLLQALQQLQQQGKRYTLIIAGEFYEDLEKYQQLIDQLGIRQQLVLKTDFIPNHEVALYFAAADVVVQPYKNATQSGVTPLAYHFEKPMIVTNVGALPDYVPHNKAGLVCEPTANSIATAITNFFEKGFAFFLPDLLEEKKKYSWPVLVDALLQLKEQIKNT
jgi:glycosyltransferase involved in cell wall biosynthesis